MKADNFTLKKYFERINYNSEINSHISTVSEIMQCQLFSVPFENIDVQAGKIVSLVPEEIVEKILVRNRGGYCYEVNGLFAMALEELGVPYIFVAGRPMIYPVRRPKTHMAIVAEVDGEKWLIDLGFGSNSIRKPMRLDVLDVEVVQDGYLFMLGKTDESRYRLKAFVEDEWVEQYEFDLYPQEWIDFVPANHLNSTHPDTIFVKKLIVVLHNPTGKVVLMGDTLKTVSNGITTKQFVSPENRTSILATHFGLVAPE